MYGNGYGCRPGIRPFMVRHLKSKVDAVTKPVSLAPDARRDYVDARDTADAVVRAARSPLAPVNLGRGEALHIRELVDAPVPPAGTAAVGGDVPVSARAAAARGLELRSIPPRDLVADRPPSGGSGKEHV